MSEALLRGFYGAIDERTWEAFRDMFTPDVAYERPGAATIESIDDLIHFYRDVRPISSSKHELTAVITSPTAGACAGRLIARDLEGNPVEQRFADIFILENGRIRQRTTYFFRF
jgi:ketosteroid isomerase-like protein